MRILRKIPTLFTISSFVFIVPLGSVTADGTDNKNAGTAFNSLESIQINCIINDDGMESNLELTAKMINMINSSKPEERLSALSQLAGKIPIEPSSVQKILQIAIQDTDPNVRAQAVYALAQQKCADVPLILEQALQDSELSVRLMAVDSFGTDKFGISLLEQALNDEEQSVRELAAMKLEALSK
ncbi:HEAT repeat domain-containing protein [Nitrosomonas sp. JL21]|uniref:HEAT repeat domain-containing protein n=1 Tax=Nitrosomonas sp. JL21 TaxID=153949 RepID=UPI00136B4827|nr:HEAT repeat domain-containing protein [Nitrosomonas sp. JL21]MXS78090.1 HEAT repeat domain-containing protein [Nitrosomonas sp. JL21]